MSEKQYEIAKNIFVTVSDIHRFGTDAVLLAHFASPKRNDTACDLGTGCGIIPLLWCREPFPKKITAVDIQRDAIELIKKSCEDSGVCDRIEPVCADLRELSDRNGKYTLVTMNPPYKPLGSGIISEAQGEKLTRHESTCTLEDAASAASKLLNFAGRFCICHRPERLTDIICTFRKFNLEVKKIRFVSQRKDTAPWLVLIEGKKGARPSVTVAPPLIIENDDGTSTDETEEIYAFYREMKK